MERSALTEVFWADIQTFLEEVGQTHWLVSLSSHMQHVNALAVLRKAVCPMLNEQANEAHITMKRSKVQRGEPIIAPAVGV